MDARSLTRPDLDALPAYKPGRRAADLGLASAVKLASNELPFAPGPAVHDAIVRAAREAHRYPDMFAVELRQAIADRHGVDVERVLTGCGSVALCGDLVTATCAPGDEVVFGWRSFEAYPILTARAGATAVPVPNREDHTLDLRALAAAITERTRLVFVCTPNNPTGGAVTRIALTRLLDGVPPDVVVAIDEAYREFVTDPDVGDGVEIARDRPNVVVLRTFSKAWGLAALRVGYAIAPPPLAQAVRKVTTPFSTSAPAQAAALAALSEADVMRERVAGVVAERARVLARLRGLLPSVPDTQANFVWLPLGADAAKFGDLFEERGVILRPFPGDGVRMTIGTPAENDLFLRIAGELFDGYAPAG